VLTIARERFPQMRQPGIRAVLVNESRETDATLALAAMALDFEQVDFADQLGGGD
jgi:hypothetical protein